MNRLSVQALVAIMVVMVCFSALFSCIETAYSSSSKIRLKSLANDHQEKAEGVLKILDNYEKFISTVLVGNNLVNIMASTVSTLIFIRFFQDDGPTVSTVVATIVILMFGEIAPKTIAKQSPEKTAMRFLGLVQFFEVILTPFTLLFGLWQKGVTMVFKNEENTADISDELITMVDEAEKEGDLEEHESDLISAAIEFNDLEVKDVLTPRVQVVAIDITESIQKIEETFRLNSYSRLPVYENNVDNIVGVIHEKDLYSYLYQDNGSKDKSSYKRMVKPVIYTSENVKISSLLKQLQMAKLHLAVVLDEYGGTAGIITMEDIIEELVGEIWDEHDTVKEYYQQINDNTFLVQANCDIDDMLERFQVEDFEVEDYDFITVSGWVIHHLNRIPKVGDTFTFANLDVTVTKADQKKVIEIKVVIHQNTDKTKEEKD